MIDLRIKFGLPEAGTTERTCIIVVQVSGTAGAKLQMGLIVDAVEEVRNISQADIEETPDFGAKVDTDYLLGMAKAKAVVIALLDIERVVSPEALRAGF